MIFQNAGYGDELAFVDGRQLVNLSAVKRNIGVRPHDLGLHFRVSVPPDVISTSWTCPDHVICVPETDCQ